MLELPLHLVCEVKYKYKQIKDEIALGATQGVSVLSNTNTNTNIWREPYVGATPRACQCCLLKAIDCDSRLSNYQLISQLSATIITFVIVLVVLALVRVLVFVMLVFVLVVLVLVFVMLVLVFVLVVLVMIVIRVSQTIN